jgi:hypothetical protein
VAAGRVDFLEDIEQIPSGIALTALVLWIPANSLPSFNEESLVPVAIQNDPLSVRETFKLVLRDLHSDDERGGREIFGHPAFQSDKAAEKL